MQINPGSTFTHSRKIKEFIKSNPGTYAMGDRAGLVAYISDASILQLEGLASNYQLLDHIKHNDDLISVLHENRIDYLLVSIYKPLRKINNSYYYVESPSSTQCGNSTPKLKGYLLTDPIFFYTASDEQSALYKNITGMPPPTTYTYIFRIEKKTRVWPYTLPAEPK